MVRSNPQEWSILKRVKEVTWEYMDDRNIEAEYIEEAVKNKYSIERILGKGARAIVYYVRNMEDGRGYALKVSEDVTTLKTERFYLEKAQHILFPKFVEWMEGERAYLVMEYIDGSNLQEILDKNILFHADEAVWILSELLEGIEFLHKQEPAMVFRDLKPANILVEKTGKVRIVDLGSVTEVHMETREKQKVRTGTYGYAAPEQFWEGMAPKPDWDVYAAGKILGYLLTGRNPAIPPYHVEEIYRKDKKIPESLRNIIKRCLSENAEARYKDAGELRRALCMAGDDLKRNRKYFKLRNREQEYKKCIWLSDYRRIF